MGSVEEVSRLLSLWEQENESGSDVAGTLTKLAELFEYETELFLKQDPDPFDDRHPSRSQPDCILGHMLKQVFKNEKIVDEMVKVYCQRDVLELNTVVCRLLLDILPGLENVIFQEEGFVTRLMHWAQHAPNPLQSYATGLLAAAMDVQEIAANYREKNSYFVPLMIKRLHDLSNLYLQSVPSVELNSADRPFAHLNDESEDPLLEASCSNKVSKKFRKKEDLSYSKLIRYSPISRQTSSKFIQGKQDQKSSPSNRITPVATGSLTSINEGSNSNWSELEHFMIGSYQVYPLTLAAQQRYILQYLTPMGEYQDLIGHVFEANALPLILRYIDLLQNPDVRLAFEALKYLASVLCHKKIALEFINIGGLQLLLKVPRPSIAATGVSICLYYLAYIEEATERICYLPAPIVSDVVGYALWLLECSHDSSRCHATMFFGISFAFRAMLFHFDEQDGLRKLFNVMSTLEVFVLESTRNLSDDQIFGNRQTTKHVCGAIKRYFEAHLALEAEERRLSHSNKLDKTSRSDYQTIKAACYTYEKVQQNIESLLEFSTVPMCYWKPVDEFFHLDGISFLLGLISSYFELSYSGRAETVKNALDILKICSLTAKTQLVFCEKISMSNSNHQSIAGISVLLQAAEGEELPEPDIQRSALHTIINCVCSPLPVLESFSRSPAVAKRKLVRNGEELLNKLWKCVRTSNGIMVLINLISVKTPITDADSLRALACKTLCGLARSETVKQIISKLPLVTNGQLLALMKEPVLQDKWQEHVKFCKYGLELIERVTGAPVTAGSESSMLNINKAEVVAKTKVVYHETQLLQLISEHLSRKGFNETVTCLEHEMGRMLLTATSSSPLSPHPRNPFKTPRPVLRSPLLIDRCNNYIHNSLSPSNPCSGTLLSIPPPSVPLRIVMKKKQPIQCKTPGNRLQS